jgi:Rho-binding antiterminator
MHSDHKPISCAFHDELELRALRRQSCRLVYRDDDNHEISLDTFIADLLTRDGREFAVITHGALIPLDRILSVDGLHP